MFSDRFNGQSIITSEANVIEVDVWPREPLNIADPYPSVKNKQNDRDESPPFLSTTRATVTSRAASSSLNVK